MSTLTFAAHTVVFTGATLEELHDQICKYVVKAGLAAEEAPVAVEPKPVIAPEPDFVGSDGRLLIKSEAEFAHWLTMLTASYPVAANLHHIKQCYALMKEALVTMPPLLAAAAKELAAKHSYGAPEHLVAEYHYNRWMIAQEELAARMRFRMQGLVKSDRVLNTQIDEIVDPILRLQECNFFRNRLQSLAVKLIKEHGWKGPTNYNLAGTEFQKAAIDASKVRVGGCYTLKPQFSLHSHKLTEALKAQ